MQVSCVCSSCDVLAVLRSLSLSQLHVTLSSPCRQGGAAAKTDRMQSRKLRQNSSCTPEAIHTGVCNGACFYRVPTKVMQAIFAEEGSICAQIAATDMSHTAMGTCVCTRVKHSQSRKKLTRAVGSQELTSATLQTSTLGEIMSKRAAQKAPSTNMLHPWIPTGAVRMSVTHARAIPGPSGDLSLHARDRCSVATTLVWYPRLRLACVRTQCIVHGRHPQP